MVVRTGAINHPRIITTELNENNKLSDTIPILVDLINKQ
jgi:hypothetical protein